MWVKKFGEIIENNVFSIENCEPFSLLVKKTVHTYAHIMHIHIWDITEICYKKII